ncbi:MAG: glycine reductase, partial [Actinomycetota bacterium]
MAPLAPDLPEAFESQPIQYLHRTRAWYAALGYEPYRWPHHEEVAFTPMAMPLAQARLGLVTTAAPYQPDKGDQGPGAAYNGSAKFFDVYTSPVDEPADVRISHIGYDRHHTKADDVNTWFPLPRLQEAVAAGRVG